MAERKESSKEKKTAAQKAGCWVATRVFGRAAPQAAGSVALMVGMTAPSMAGKRELLRVGWRAAPMAGSTADLKVGSRAELWAASTVARKGLGRDVWKGAYLADMKDGSKALRQAAKTVWTRVEKKVVWKVVQKVRSEDERTAELTVVMKAAPKAAWMVALKDGLLGDHWEIDWAVETVDRMAAKRAVWKAGKKDSG